MKKIFLFIVIIFISCDEISTIETHVSNWYIGPPGTTRQYKETKRSYFKDTNTPVLDGIDTLFTNPILTQEEFEMGVIEYYYYTEEVIQIEDDYYRDYDFLIFPLENSFRLDRKGRYYNLVDHINTIYNPDLQIYGYDGQEYREHELCMSYVDEFFFEDNDQVYNLYHSEIYILKSPENDLAWEREYLHGENKYNAQFKGVQTVNVQAGEFLAYKIEITGINDSGNIINTICEYYVPNIGMVLSERNYIGFISSNLFYGIFNSSYLYYPLLPEGREIIYSSRKELVSYNMPE